MLLARWIVRSVPLEIVGSSGHEKWLATVTTVPLGLGSNPGEDMDVCKCIVPLQHGGTLTSRRATSPLLRLMEGDEMWEAPGNSQGFLPQNWGGTERNHTVTCMVLKAKANEIGSKL
ncbi:uncharacterized protein TNCV_4834571 [Trichonephila clavipes]|nr:uncharacterized protein TNCV_4834571 [Trichonephila clavipes]